MKTYTKEEIAKMYGKEVVSAALASDAMPTNRVIDSANEPAAHEDKHEYAGTPVEVEDGVSVRAYWYLTDEDENDMGFFDWESNVEFQVSR